MKRLNMGAHCNMYGRCCCFSLVGSGHSKRKRTCLEWSFLTMLLADQSTRDLVAMQRLWERTVQVEGKASAKTLETKRSFTVRATNNNNKRANMA